MLFQQLTESIDSKTLSGTEGVRYGDLLLRWYAMYPAVPPGATQVARGTRTMDGYLARQFRNALAAMSVDDAEAFVRKIFAVPGRANGQYWYQVLPDSTKADGVRVATAAHSRVVPGAAKPPLRRGQADTCTPDAWLGSAPQAAGRVPSGDPGFVDRR